MSKRVELHNNVTESLLLKNGFSKTGSNKYSIRKVIYKPLLVLKMDIDLTEKEVSYDIIDRNNQTTYFPFWNNVNGENNLVALEAEKNFNNYIEKLRDKKILRRFRRYNKRTKKN